MDEISERILRVYEESILNERKFDLGSGHKGNGITIWNRAKEIHGDYETIAHIDPNRKITYYIKNPPPEVKTYVEKIAKGKNMSVSTTQKDKKIFNEELDEMKMTAMDAIAILAKGDENAAWKKAQEDEGLLSNVTKKMWLKWAYASKQYKKLKESINVNEGEIEDFIDDSRVADAVFKDLQIATNDMIMKTIIPGMKKYQDKIVKKYKLGKSARMNVDYFGTAYIHDVFRQLIGQEMLSVTGGLKRIMSRTK